MPKETLYRVLERYEPKVRTYFARRVRDAQNVEDLVQETMCAVIEAFPRYRGDASVATWVYAICSNQLGSFYRNRDRRSRLFERLILNGDSGIVDTPDADLIKLTLEVAYERLPEAMKRLFEDRYKSGMSVCEIAESQQRAEGTIKYQLYLLRIEIRRILG